MANSYLTHTHGSAATLLTKGTFSAWVKRSAPTGEQTIFTGNKSDNNQRDFVRFEANSQLRARGCGGDFNLETTQVFRDTNAWYHVVVSIDTTQGTAADRVKMYVNGSQVTAFNSPSYPSQDYVLEGWSNQTLQTVGRDGKDSNTPFDGYLSHVVWVDGTALTPTSFGETDSTSGIWKFKSPSGITFGNNGFHLKFENAGALGTDSSGNSNTFTVNGNLKQALDTPSNVHCTVNPLNKTSNILILNGNCSMGTTNTGTDEAVGATLACENSKWYWENKDAGAGDPGVGIVKITANNDNLNNQRVLYHHNGNIYTDGLSGVSAINTGVTYTTNDIISVAFDTENGNIKFYKNDTLVNNSSITNSQLEYANNIWTPMWYAANGNGSAAIHANFGSGFFGTTAISSAGSNGNGSLFEYDVPSGYYALNTKNINTYG